MPTNKTMRITGGILLRRRFLIPPMVDEGTVRPTPDRVREAIFSMIVFDLKEARVLDLFAGSGAHSFEAISRGAKSACLVEKDARVAAVIKENLRSLGINEQCEIKISDAQKWVMDVPRQVYDVIFVDPPYSLKLDADFFRALAKHLSKSGVIIFRCFKKDHSDFSDSLTVERDRCYGGTRVFIMRSALT